MLGTLSACGGGAKTEDIAVIDVAPAAVESVTFIASGNSATLRAVDGIWTPAAGATVQAATQLTASSDRFFPLNTYRTLEGLNQNDPAYGLAGQNPAAPKECQPVCAISVTDTAGKTWKLTVGAPTFNGGFYGKLEGDPRVFLLTKVTVAGIVSQAIGKDFAFPESAQIRKIDKTLQGLDEAGRKKAEAPDYDPYLRQVLAAEQAEAAKKAGGTGGEAVLLKAAGSTQDQPGAKDGKDVKNNSDALNPTGASR